MDSPEENDLLEKLVPVRKGGLCTSIYTGDRVDVPQEKLITVKTINGVYYIPVHLS